MEPQYNPVPRHHMHPALPGVIAVLSLIILIGAYFAIRTPATQSPTPTPSTRFIE